MEEQNTESFQGIEKKPREVREVREPKRKGERRERERRIYQNVFKAGGGAEIETM